MFGPREEPSLSAEIGQALELTALAIGRLDALVAASPARRAWQRRSTFLATVRAVEADGYIFEIERLFALAANLPVPRVKDYGIDAMALDVLGQMMKLAALSDGEPAAAGELDKAIEVVRLSQRAGAVLTGALQGLRRWVADDGRPSLGLIAFARVVAERGVTSEPVPWLAGAISSRAIMTDGLSAARWARRALQEIAGAMEAGCRILGALEATREAWHRRLGPRRSTSRLDLVVELALAYPVLSPVQVSRVLGTSVRGGAKLLDELAELQILLPPRREGTWRFFIASDLRDIRSHVLGEAAPAPAREVVAVASPPALPLDRLPAASRQPKPVREPEGFRDLLAATDQVVRRITDQLAQYRGKVPPEES